MPHAKSERSDDCGGSHPFMDMLEEVLLRRGAMITAFLPPDEDDEYGPTRLLVSAGPCWH